TGVSAKMLTERLRALEQAGLISRDYEPTIPPKVTYALTGRGRELGGVLDQLADLGRKWIADGIATPGIAQAAE
ncbi:MAG TPA: winged helix-turn-helix transcriptional regulator, partial [Vineibacter sp.]|nr:winged helix-turn-helix transcriptional regulator [Vineibacter sp.]